MSVGAVRGTWHAWLLRHLVRLLVSRKGWIYKQEEKNVKTKRAPGEHLRENSKEREKQTQRR